jgi:hypothetical protein
VLPGDGSNVVADIVLQQRGKVEGLRHNFVVYGGMQRNQQSKCGGTMIQSSIRSSIPHSGEGTEEQR